MYEGQGNSVVYHHSNSLARGLGREIRWKTREHDSLREHCMPREPPWSDVFSTWTPPRGYIDKGMLDFLSEEKTMYCTKLLLERAVYCQEQDGGNIRRAAH